MTNASSPANGNEPGRIDALDWLHIARKAGLNNDEISIVENTDDVATLLNADALQIDPEVRDALVSLLTIGNHDASVTQLQDYIGGQLFHLREGNPDAIDASTMQSIALLAGLMEVGLIKGTLFNRSTEDKAILAFAANSIAKITMRLSKERGRLQERLALVGLTRKYTDDERLLHETVGIDEKLIQSIISEGEQLIDGMQNGTGIAAEIDADFAQKLGDLDAQEREIKQAIEQQQRERDAWKASDMTYTKHGDAITALKESAEGKAEEIIQEFWDNLYDRDHLINARKMADEPEPHSEIDRANAMKIHALIDMAQLAGDYLIYHHGISTSSIGCMHYLIPNLIEDANDPGYQHPDGDPLFDAVEVRKCASRLFDGEDYQHELQILCGLITQELEREDNSEAQPAVMTSFAQLAASTNSENRKTLELARTLIDEEGFGEVARANAIFNEIYTAVETQEQLVPQKYSDSIKAEQIKKKQLEKQRQQIQSDAFEWKNMKAAVIDPPTREALQESIEHVRRLQTGEDGPSMYLLKSLLVVSDRRSMHSFDVNTESKPAGDPFFEVTSPVRDFWRTKRYGVRPAQFKGVGAQERFPEYEFSYGVPGIHADPEAELFLHFAYSAYLLQQDKRQFA